MGVGGVRPAVFRTGDGMAGNGVREVMRQVAVDGFDHVALGAARIGDDGGGRKMRRDLFQHLAGLRYRTGEQHEAGTFQRLRPALRGFVDDAQRDGAFQGFTAATHADNLFGQSAPTQRQGERAANQTDAADDDFFEGFHGAGKQVWKEEGQRCRARSSAAMQAAFSASVPMLMRNHSGRP